MARPLRRAFPGALYHLTSRGHDRADISLGDADRQAFLDVLGEVCRRMQWVCYAYCLIPNHYHLVVETQAGHLSKGMRQVNGVYTQRFNRGHGRVGHVLQGGPCRVYPIGEIEAPFSPALLMQAHLETQSAGLRALDALHVAAAKVSGAENRYTMKRCDLE